MDRDELFNQLRINTRWTFAQIAAWIAGYFNDPPTEDVADWPEFYRAGMENLLPEWGAAEAAEEKDECSTQA